METLRTFEELHPYLLNEEALKELKVDDLLTIMENFDYYMSPVEFEEFSKDYSESFGIISMIGKSDMYESIARDTIANLIIKHFDIKIYKKKIKKLNERENINLRLRLFVELNELNSKELTILIHHIISCRVDFHLFVKSVDRVQFLETINGIANEINPKVPLLDGVDLFNGDLLLETLSHADSLELVVAIRTYVTKDIILLIKMIRKCFGNNPIAYEKFIEKEVKPYVKSQMD
ncbi:MAG: hypothetical protein K6E20_04160 [Acholeplasmatales bacterium]|nr:hypothetical protein [Acholeplasmatales bacterium]